MKEENKHYEVVISKKAADMLIQHIRFLAEVNPIAADNLREKVIYSSKSLQNSPERNPWLRDSLLPSRKYRKLIVGKRYLLIYQIKNETVYVDYILDCRRNYRWLL